MKNKILYTLGLSVALSSNLVFAEPEVTGKLTLEVAKFNNSYTSTETSSVSTATSHGKDTFKNEKSARIYIDGEANQLRDGATYHVELQGYNNSEALDRFDGPETDTQRDVLREAYIDTSYNDWMLRLGKQQVVWGTADGIKLLDAINPTDYTELVQNQMEDSRIPVWMINAEKDLEDGSNFQVIVSDPKANYIPGLSKSSGAARTHSNSDRGHAFIMKGVDSITGRTNGFLNAVGDIGKTAYIFNNGFTTLANSYASTVGEFMNNEVPSFAAHQTACLPDSSAGCSAADLAAYANSSAQSTTNVINATTIAATQTDYSTYGSNANEGGTNPDTVFAYMTDATFATFDAFSNATAKYVVDHDTDKPNLGLRYKNTTDGGTNYSLNFMRRYDSNPYVSMQWESSTGTKLIQDVSTYTGLGQDANEPAYGTYFNADQEDRVYRTLTLTDADNNSYGYQSGGGGNTLVVEAPVLAFYEKLNEVTSIGGSLDTTIETQGLGPVVFRAEALYTKDEMMPTVDRNKLAYGDLPGGLTMKKSDTFKYVLGFDITALTNMMVSTQFIQMRNLDFVDNNTDADGNACGSKVNCGVYTGDMATLHLTNGLQKAEENKEFYSLFLSKPFGESGQHRWNNIFMYEENGGKWNRLDFEYTIDDNTVATLEFNKYFGNKDTQFGQFKDSSNTQIGLKYIF